MSKKHAVSALVIALAVPSLALAQQSGGGDPITPRGPGEPIHVGGGLSNAFGSATSSIKGLFGFGGGDSGGSGSGEPKCEQTIETNAAGEPVYAQKSPACP